MKLRVLEYSLVVSQLVLSFHYLYFVLQIMDLENEYFNDILVNLF